MNCITFSRDSGDSHRGKIYHDLRVVSILVLLMLIALARMVSANGVISNGDFETGDLTGWTASVIAAVQPPPPLTPLISVSAVGGNHFAVFETGEFATGPFISTLEQTFPVPDNFVLRFDFSFSTDDDATGGGSSPFFDAFAVSLTAGGSTYELLLADRSGAHDDPFGTAPGTTALDMPTGPLFDFRYVADLSALAGQTATLYFDIISEDDGMVASARIDNVNTRITANVDIDPNTLNLRSMGRWITCYLELQRDHDVADIDVASIRLNDVIPAETKPTGIGDYDDDGDPDLMVKFDRAEVIALLSPGQITPITISGNVGGQQFGGTDYINVISRPVYPAEDEDSTPLIETVTLEVHPNPFNPSAQISYGIPNSCRVVIQVWDIQGRLVRTIEDTEKAPGIYSTEWNGKNEAGRIVSSGIYFCRLVAGSDGIITKKLMLLR